MANQSEYTLISIDTPLISNLNMYENIAIIKEFHEHLSINEAEEEASIFLSKIGADNIGKKRVPECDSLEIFYVMFIRSLMTKDMNVIIVSPFSIADNIDDMKAVIHNLSALNNGKSILILDLSSNKLHYEESLCNMIG